ncbi:MAG TPA: hypothetical protein VGX70_16880 [Gemmataceae bacterium]|jgi:hypothetical protein|nr:hypothetical protein [Gemmataceae bacterium]
MLGCRLLTTAGVIIALAAFASTANAGGGKKKLHAAHGRVTDVASDGSTFTLEVRPHKNKNAPVPATPPAPVEKKFKVDKDTKVEFVSGKKGEREFTPAAVSDIHKGEHVLVVMRTGQADMADKVVIVKHKKKT